MSKRILIVADTRSSSHRLFLYASRHLAKGFTRLGHDATVFSYAGALMELSPIKSKGFSSRFYKPKVDRMLCDYIRGYDPHVVVICFPRQLDATTVACVRRVTRAVLVGVDLDPWPERRKQTQVGATLDIVAATNDGEFLDTYRRSGTPLCAFLPNVCDPDVNRRYEEVDPRWQSDLLWTGKTRHGVDESDTVREAIVTQLAAMPYAAVYGCLNKEKIGGIQYLYAISGSRIGVSINAINTVRLYHSDRLVHYAAGGTLALVKRVPDSELLFQDGIHVKYFDTTEEFFDLAQWFLSHEDERRRIADAGMEHAHRSYNCQVVAGYLLDLVEKGRYDAPWT
ncbi:MAG: glycosyltransferase [Planctomycetota bacterium]|nr:glycosyltransferase [Planctomycetota bacterium]